MEVMSLRVKVKQKWKAGFQRFKIISHLILFLKSSKNGFFHFEKFLIFFSVLKNNKICGRPGRRLMQIE